MQALIAREPGEKTTLIRQALLSLPVKEGGLGLPIHALLAPGLYRAAKEAAQSILVEICPKLFPEPLRRPLPTAQEVFSSVNQDLEENILPTLSEQALKSKLENASYFGRY